MNRDEPAHAKEEGIHVDKPTTIGRCNDFVYPTNSQKEGFNGRFVQAAPLLPFPFVLFVTERKETDDVSA